MQQKPACVSRDQQLCFEQLLSLRGALISESKMGSWIERKFKLLIMRGLCCFAACLILEGVNLPYSCPAALASMIPLTYGKHSDTVRSLAFSPDGRSLAAGSGPNIEIWDTATGSLLKTLSGHSDDVKSLVFSPDGRSLASYGDDCTIRIWNTATGSLLKTLKTLSGLPKKVQSMAFSPDGHSLASCDMEVTIRIWDTATGSLVKTLSTGEHLSRSLTFSPDSRSLAGLRLDSTISIWDTATGSLIKTLSRTREPQSMAFSPDGRSLAGANWDHTISIWDTTTGSLLKTLSDDIGYVRSMAFSPDGRSLAAGGDPDIGIWDTATGSLLKTLSGHTKQVQSMAFSPDGRSLASCSDDKTIKIWPVWNDEILCKYVPKSADLSSIASTKVPQTLASMPIDDKVSVNSEAAKIGTNGAVDRPIRDKWAVIVGVSKFKDSTIPRLKFPAKDARDFYNFLTTKANFKADHVRLLTDEIATRERIWTEVGDTFLPRVVGPDDLVVLYFSTHGSSPDRDVRKNNYLIAYDTPKSRMYADGIKMQDIVDELNQRTGADRVLIVLDACHSGAADPNAKALDFNTSVDIDKFAVGSGHIILTSSESSESSYESDHDRNGIFTKQLIRVLSSNSKIIESFSSLKDSVSDQARQEFGKRQTPRLKADSWAGRDLLLSAPATHPRTISATVKKLLEPDSTAATPALALPRSKSSTTSSATQAKKR